MENFVVIEFDRLGSGISVKNSRNAARTTQAAARSGALLSTLGNSNFNSHKNSRVVKA
jgi:hypothetical protein